MRGQLIWDNDEKTALRQVYPANLTAADVQELAKATYDLIKPLPHTVHLIIEAGKFNRAMREVFLQASRSLDQTVAPNQGHVIVVTETGDNIAMQFTTQAASITAPKATSNNHTVKSLEEARAIIASLGSKK